MGDEQLRTLERRFKETGAAGDEVAWLAARVRAGEALSPAEYTRLARGAPELATGCLERLVADGRVAPRDVDLLAYLGHAPAQALAPDVRPERSSRASWFGGLFARSARAALGLAGLVVQDALSEAPRGLRAQVEEAAGCALAAWQTGGGDPERVGAVHERCSFALNQARDVDDVGVAWVGVHLSLAAALLIAPEPISDRQVYLSWRPGPTAGEAARNAARSAFTWSTASEAFQDPARWDALHAELGLRLLARLS